MSRIGKLPIKIPAGVQVTIAEDNTVKSLDDTAFYKKQMRIALRNCGVINPENIDE